MSVAFVFPGQGAQYAGMGKQMAAAFAPARDAFRRADEVLGFPGGRGSCRAGFGQGIVGPSDLHRPGAVVVGGDEDAVHEGMRLAREAGAKRAVPLPVSAPFHTSLMRPAATRLAEALSGIPIVPATIPVVSNVTAQPVREPGDIRRVLVEQVASPVRWDESVRAMWDAGMTTFVEVGPGTTLSGLIRKTVPAARMVHVQDPEALREAGAACEVSPSDG